MKYKVAELESALLDLAIAKIEGHVVRVCDEGVFLEKAAHPYIRELYPPSDVFAPSTEWAHGGPIIKYARISLHFNVGFLAEQEGRSWDAKVSGKTRWVATGATPLLAAMRAFVASRLGEEIELP